MAKQERPRPTPIPTPNVVRLLRRFVRVLERVLAALRRDARRVPPPVNEPKIKPAPRVH